MDGGVGWITYTRSVYLNRSHGNRKVLAIHIPSFDPGLPPQSVSSSNRLVGHRSTYPALGLVDHMSTRMCVSVSVCTRVRRWRSASPAPDGMTGAASDEKPLPM